MRTRKSRLTRKEELRSIRRAIFYGGLTLIIALSLVFLGIPALIKMAIFLGDLRGSSLPIESKDTFPPSPPVLKPLAEATNSARIKIEGTAEAGAIIEIFLSDSPIAKVTAGQDGSFVFRETDLALGKNEIYASATDKDGNQSQESKIMTVFYDRTPPELELIDQEDEPEFSGEQNRIEIAGKTEPDTSVYVNDHLVIIDREGNFRYPVMLKEGENMITVTAQDRAGNQTTKEKIVNYSL